MIKMYKIFNPYTGLHQDAHNVEELFDSLITHAWSSYLELTGGSPYTIVQINDDGSQIWKSPSGEEIPRIYDQNTFTAAQKERFLRHMPLILTQLGGVDRETEDVNFNYSSTVTLNDATWFMPDNHYSSVQTTMAAVSNIWLRQIKFLQSGAQLPGHTHLHDHLTLLASGKIKVTVNDKVSEFSAPHMIFIHKDHQHTLEALEENTVAYCIHAIREKDTGDIIEGVGIGIPLGIETEPFTTE